MSWLVADICAVQVFLVSTPFVIGNFDVASEPSVPLLVAGSTVIAIGIAESASRSLLTTALTMAIWAYGCSNLAGVENPFTIFNLDYLLVEWALAAAVRRLVVGSARNTDTATAAVNAAHVASEVSDARRRYEREQWALMHDTAASTLLMVGQASALNTARLAEQAKRDIAAIELVPHPDDEGPIDLVPMLRDICTECVTPVQFVGRNELDVDPIIGRAITAATREALNNVDRHSNATVAVVSIEEHAISVKDDGVGFDCASDLSTTRHGIRNSIVGRLRDVHGEATITSEPEMGTDVEMTWTDNATVETSVDHDKSEIDIARILHRYGYGLVTVAVVVALLGTIPMWSGHSPLGWKAELLVAFDIAAAVVAAAAIRRPVPGLALWQLAVICTAPAQQLMIDAGHLTDIEGIKIATTWTLVALTFRSTPRKSLLLLAGGWFLACAVELVRSPTRETAAILGCDIAGIAFVQGIAIIFVVLLRSGWSQWRELAHQYARISALQAINQALQRDYYRRYEELSRSVVPLLRGLADRTLSPCDPGMRARALIDAARLRRLFAQSDSFDHPLLQELRPSIDRAEAEGVNVTFDIAAALPELTDDARCELLAAPMLLLARSRSQARIVVTTGPGSVTLSVVCDCTAEARNAVEGLPNTARFELTTLGELTWIKLHHTLIESTGQLQL
ncbi:sensor histidine kinase [Antrihabitans cavernicola]|uniref:ATP-binding protein n=1 Tax=Antrihabitans cavernicola TaxID=2495913 RepID=A0A5A7SJT3_9NOCA|nr:hypothetical protein [Spelaeibacter cavernicola]KAA0024913.1 hypothetical protein FOY51_03035 [Spelaeibacter cavernicola]